MIDYSYVEIERAVRGKLLAPTRRKRFKGKVFTDTRNMEAGSLFIALRGKNFDGHDYIDQAFEKGARLCIAEVGSNRKIRRKDPDVIFVENTMQALGRLGSFHRRQQKIPVIAITGSCGKTTTKELIAHLLSSKMKVLKTDGTENNYIGVPKTLLNYDGEDVMVLEIGTNAMGEIRHLSRMVNPTHAVITLIGNAHLLGFRSLQGVKREKLSMVEALEDGTTLIYNADDKNIVHPRMKTIKTIRAGFSKRYEVYAEDIELEMHGSKFMLNGQYPVQSNLMGRHNIIDVLLAAGAANSLGVAFKDVGKIMQNFEAPKGRIRHQEVKGVDWIDDSYNSNPSSLKAAIELFKSYPPKGRKILVIGDMLELGIRAQAFHREAGRQIADHPFDLVLTVGEMAQRFSKEAVFHGFDPLKIRAFKTSDEAGKFLKSQIKPADTVLLKGSRGMRMEKVMEICNGETQ